MNRNEKDFIVFRKSMSELAYERLVLGMHCIDAMAMPAVPHHLNCGNVLIDVFGGLIRMAYLDVFPQLDTFTCSATLRDRSLLYTLHTYTYVYILIHIDNNYHEFLNLNYISKYG